MSSILMGALGAAAIAIAAFIVLDYGGAPSEETFSAPESVRLD